MGHFSVLASGSKANATVVIDGHQSLLIDCGLSAREVERRLWLVGIDPASLLGIIVTHEHSDHIRGVGILSRRLKIPVYANAATGEFISDPHRMERFETGTSIQIDRFTVTSFPIVHDAVDPIGVSVTWPQGQKLVMVTDVGRITQVVRHAIRDAETLVLEANYDELLLTESGYPWQVKQRIASSHGHLSNKAAAEFLVSHLADTLEGQPMRRGLMGNALEYVVLAHLSEQSNSPRHALDAVEAALAPLLWRPSVCCGSPSEPTPVRPVASSVPPWGAQRKIVAFG